ncbi:site-specific integrase [Kistimonas scapharcae]|uniref:Site-specific integrase n=2 Tax=Kistimonas scapharcae TaxID=1036133 RepID=A0ABP8V038_9GAMM
MSYAGRALAKNTLLAIESDWKVFCAFCAVRSLRPLPADRTTVEQFLRYMASSRATTTLGRYLSSISTLHQVAGLDNPCITMEVKYTLQEIRRNYGTAPRQAHPLRLEHLEQLTSHYTDIDSLTARRDIALLSVAYDAMLRTSEICTVKVSDLSISDDGTGIVHLTHSKTDQAGQGAELFLSDQTVALVGEWLEAANIDSGALFRGIKRPFGKQEIIQDRAISRSTAYRIFRSASEMLGGEPWSGHSTRVGAAQDLVEANMDTAAIQQAGRWASSQMVHRYSRKITAGRSAMAKFRQSRKDNND